MFFVVVMWGEGLKTGAQYVIAYTPHYNHVYAQFWQLFASLLFFRDYGLKYLDEKLKINNKADIAIQYQTICSTTMNWSVGKYAWMVTTDANLTLLPGRLRQEMM